MECRLLVAKPPSPGFAPTGTGTSAILKTSHTLDSPPYIGLEILSLISAPLIKAALTKVIIPLSKQLSIIFGF